MKRDVTKYVYKCLTCQQVKAEHKVLSGLLNPIPIPQWKWDNIAMDFVSGLPLTQKKHDSVWVIIDRLTKSAHFIPVRIDYLWIDYMSYMWMRFSKCMVFHCLSCQTETQDLRPDFGRNYSQPWVLG